MDKSWESEESQGLRIPAARVLYGSCLDRLKDLPDGSIDSIVTDPPYELGFMGKKWDSSGIAYNIEVWRECLRVLKAGGHLLAFGGTRTMHRIACAIEDAGFEIRDMISWLYFSGMPKNHNIPHAIDSTILSGSSSTISMRETELEHGTGSYQDTSPNNGILGQPVTKERRTLEPQTPEAQKWAGYGTALKPSQEPIILARKPIAAGTIARQILETGTGAINIDGCRFGYGDPCWVGPNDPTGDRSISGWQNSYVGGVLEKPISVTENPLGRWPANIYQCAKPSRSEKEAGCQDLPHITGAQATNRKEGSAGLQNPRAGSGWSSSEIRNTHPTVKPLKLMRWLVRLVTPQGGTVLDPFCGSGTTIAAATLEGFDSVGVELTAEYLPIIHARVEWSRSEFWNEHLQLGIPW